MRRPALLGVALLALSASAARAQGGIGQTFIAPSSNVLFGLNTGQLFGFASSSYTYALYALSGSGSPWTLMGPPLFQQSVQGPVSQSVGLNVDALLRPGAPYAFLLLGDSLGATICRPAPTHTRCMR